MKNHFLTFEEAISFFPDAVIVVDECNTMLALNAPTAHLFGYQQEQLIGKSLNVLLPDQLNIRLSDYLTKSKIYEMGKSLIFSGYRKDGFRISVDVALAPIIVNNKSLLIATFRDVTHSKEIERKLLTQIEQLKAKQEELEKFSYMIAHDLKSPLINLHAVVHLMNKELPDKKNTKLAEYIAAVQNSLESITNLISGIAAYSKSGTGNIEEDINLNQVMADVRKLIKIPYNGHLLQEGKLPVISGNKTKVLQIFLNLICNAFKHNDNPTPCVKVSSSEKNGATLISVSDNGPGVPKSLRKRIFRLFDKGNSSRVDSQGIGLSIVKKLVEEHGGSVTVNEGRLGGADFVFSWPSDHAKAYKPMESKANGYSFAARA
ncbi:PAS domain-containing sensor histidine kinase [Pontibacter sp. H249]|uniref:PAS domain-containing sensor histidine kinase n=1 Tax=Pontibacter sp. H249 TaxID=3133420 RepID=UPI0030BB2FF9